MPNAYDEDLAYIHDVGWGGFATGSAPGLLDLLRRNRIREGLVVDLGCGSGLWAAELLRAGYDVFGVDISAAMLRIARRRAPQARFVRGSFLDAELPQCAAVTALGEVFNYLFDARHGPEYLEPLFARVHEALHPGGLFLFDVATPGRGRGPRQRHFSGDGWALLLETEESVRPPLLSRKITSFRRVGRSYRRAEETHLVRLFRPGEVLAALRRAAFKVRTLRAYGRYRLAPGVIGFVARREEAVPKS